MLHWRELLGLKPRIGDLAAAMLARARAFGDAEWLFDPEKAALNHPRDGTINLTNIFLEYCNAPRAARKHLLSKYEAMLQTGASEVPKLWALASQHIYPVIRSIYDRVLLEIAARGGKLPLPPAVSWPLCGEVQIRLVFDHGQALAHVEEAFLETWGQATEAVKLQALQNLRALERPVWRLLGDGVYQVVSEVSYEESFLLVDSVIDALPFAASAVVMPTNRGVLLACDGTSDRAVRIMLSHAERFLRDSPWPLSATLLQRRHGQWCEFVPSGETLRAHRSVQRISLAVTYADQQSALQEQLGDDVFVGTYSLIKRDDGFGEVNSWSSWTEGVATLLPKSDLVALGRAKPDGSHTVMLVTWSALMATCGNRINQTEEFPARFAVDGFPSEEEWLVLAREAELIN